MEYIINGNFQKELQDGWATTYPVHRRADEQAGEPDEQFFAYFGAGGQLAQSFTLNAPKPFSVRLSLGIQVTGGDNKPNGNLLLTVMSQAGTDPWQYQTYAINEFESWQTAYLVLPVDKSIERMGVIFAVSRGFNAGVSIRKVSFTDAVAVDASGVEKRYEGPVRPEGLPADFG